MGWAGVFLNARGRLGRKAFWTAWLALAGLAALLLLLGPIGRPLALLLVIPQVCLLSQRLHDLGKSGWFSAIPCGLALAAWLAAAFADAAGAPSDAAYGGVMVAAACTVVGLIFFVRVGCARVEAAPVTLAAEAAAANSDEAPQQAA